MKSQDVKNLVQICAHLLLVFPVVVRHQICISVRDGLEARNGREQRDVHSRRDEMEHRVPTREKFDKSKNWTRYKFREIVL